jgi:hypothetical protein
MRAKRATRANIAEVLGVSLAQVKRWIAEVKAPLPAIPNPPELQTLKEPAKPFVNPEEDLSLMERCKLILGDRMGEDRHRGYLLDKVHVSSNHVLRAAKEAGLVLPNVEPRRKSA